jgi:predicted AAA+ superfamily ATPase
MIPRHLAPHLSKALASTPCVALLGPRQVGKTTLALDLVEGADKPTTYLDLERDSDRRKLADAELYLAGQQGRLTILDEIQRVPELFPLLRSLIDERIRAGEKVGQFLILGSASPDLLRQSSESLAGRIAYLELKPFALPELIAVDGEAALARAWLRGGFPLSYLAESDQQSWEWRGNFISTYIERDIPQLAPRLPTERMRRVWSMVAHGQGDPLNLSRLASGLGVTGKTVAHSLDVLTDLYLLRQLPAWSGNSRKRLVRAPKVYVRDTGLLHRLAHVPDEATLLGHPLCGPSWEGFVIEQILAALPDTWRSSYYRTSAQAEIDLVLEGPGAQVVAIEIKRTLAPRVGKGFRLGCGDIGATAGYYVMPAGEASPLAPDVEAVPLDLLIERLGRHSDV